MSLSYFPMYPDDFEADTAHLTLAEDGAYNRLLRLCWRTPGCSIPADRAWIYRRMRALTDEDKAVIDTVLDEFFTLSEGRLSNARLKQEWVAANEAHERRKKAGAKGGASKGAAKSLRSETTDAGNAQAKPKQPEPEPEPDIEREVPSLSGDGDDEPKRGGRSSGGRDQRPPVAEHPPSSKSPPDGNRGDEDPAFERFWKSYPHRGGVMKGKAPARTKWRAAIRAGADPEKLIAAAREHHRDRRVIDGYARDPATWLNQRGWEDEIEPPRTALSTGGPNGGYGTGAGNGGSGARWHAPGDPDHPQLRGILDAAAAVAARGHGDGRG